MRAGFEILAVDVEEFTQAAAGHEARGDFRQRHAGGFRDVRHGARGTRVDFDDENFVGLAGLALNGKLQIDEADDVEREREAAGIAADGVQRAGGEIDGG